MKLALIIALLAGLSSAVCGQEPAPSPVPLTEENAAQSDAAKIAQAKWDSTRVSAAIVWKYHHFDDLFSAKQSVTVLDIDLNHPQLKIDFPYVRSGFLKTSDGADSAGAYAAINGGYFNTKTGGSTVYFRKEGTLIAPTQDGFTHYRENAGMAISEDGKVSIQQRPGNGWAASPAYSLLVSGPLLIVEGQAVEQVKQAFNTNRHPRTAVGLTRDNHLIAVVVDGRSNQSYGMTIAELTGVMAALGCENAMNFDGGGSSTAWVKDHGVVNYPCDNKQFDHEGERGVATVIAFMMEE